MSTIFNRFDWNSDVVEVLVNSKSGVSPGGSASNSPENKIPKLFVNRTSIEVSKRWDSQELGVLRNPRLSDKSNGDA